MFVFNLSSLVSLVFFLILLYPSLLTKRYSTVIFDQLLLQMPLDFLVCILFLLLLFFCLFLCGELSNPSSFCYGTTAVQDDAAPGTQEYIMLRQDSIHSADIRSKGSPFRAKCHEIFCCPLKQVVHKESAEPEGLFAPPPCFDLLMPLVSPAHSRLVFPSLSYSV